MEIWSDLLKDPLLQLWLFLPRQRAAPRVPCMVVGRPLKVNTGGVSPARGWRLSATSLSCCSCPCGPRGRCSRPPSWAAFQAARGLCWAGPGPHCRQGDGAGVAGSLSSQEEIDHRGSLGGNWPCRRLLNNPSLHVQGSFLLKKKESINQYLSYQRLVTLTRATKQILTKYPSFRNKKFKGLYYAGIERGGGNILV